MWKAIPIFGGVATVVGGLIAVILMVMAVLVAPPEPAKGNDSTCTPEGGAQNVKIPDEYVSLVNQAAAEAQVSPDVIGAQLDSESGFDPNAVSPAGAKGIAQFMDATWKEFGNGGDVFDPNDAIPAQGRYMRHLRDVVSPHSNDPEEIVKLTLAAYNAGPGTVQKYDFDLDAMFSGQTTSETRDYVKKIMAAAGGNYDSDCDTDGGGSGDGDIVKQAGYLAWDKRVELPRSSAANHGKSESKPEYVDATLKLKQPIHTAYYTDCGVFVATVMRTSGADPKYPPRGTTPAQLPYLKKSGKYETFNPTSEGDLKPGDILIKPGHTYIYTGKRHGGNDGSAQGASLYTRPPSGHAILVGSGYTAARLKG